MDAHFCKAIALGMLWLLGALVCVAQTETSGRITGTMRDPSGAVVARASVKVINRGTNEERRTLANDAGSYALPLLPPGAYAVTVAAPGFLPMVADDVRVNVTETTTLNFTLRVGAAPQSVTVSSSAELRQRDNPALGRVLDARGVSELPLATRNFTQILSLSPGTATYLPDSTALGRNTQAIAVNGARVTQNNYRMNGVNGNPLGTNAAILVPVPAPESIEEFKVQTSMYDATYGEAGGANIQILTRGGSNSFHGSGYEFFRNEALNANNPFLKAAGMPRPVLRRNVFGGTVGGPVRRDRVFFFASYQGTRERNAASLVNSISSNVLIAPGLTDDRSQATLLRVFQPLLNGKAIHPAALALLNARLPDGSYVIPTPGGDGRYSGSADSTFEEEQFNANADFNFRSDILSIRFFFANSTQLAALPSFRGAGPNVPGFAGDGVFNNRVAAIREVHPFGSNSVNEVRVGYTFNRNNASSREPVNDSDMGIRRSNADRYPGLPMIRIAPAAGGVIIGTATALVSVAAPATTTLSDTVSITRGRHTIRAGAEVRYNLQNYGNPAFARGQIDFPDFGSFLTGNASVTTLGGGLVGRAWRAFDYDFFVQHDWRVSPQLALNMGVRYELDLPFRDTRGRLSTFDPALYQPRLQVDSSGPVGPPVGGFVQAGNVIAPLDLPDVPNMSDSLLRGTDLHNFAPRIGFAWSPTLANNLVIRGGYGLFYSRPTFQYASLTDRLPPYYVLGVRNNAPVPLSDPFFLLPPPEKFPLVVTGVSLAGSAFDRNLRTPYFQQYNLGAQYELRRDLLIETDFVGSRGVNLFRQVAINQARLASPDAPIVNAVTGAAITTNAKSNAVLRAPLQGVSISGFTQNQSTAQSSYNSLQASLLKRAAHGLEMQASYTFAKSLDNASGQGGGAGIAGIVNTGAVGDTGGILGNQFDPRSNRGPSDFDRKHRLVISYLWDVPTPAFARQPGWSRWLFSNWKTSGIVVAMSGLPVDVVDTGSGSLYGLSGGSTPLARPNFAPGETCSTASEHAPVRYFFNPLAFAQPVVAAGQPIPSSGGRAIATGPGATDIGTVGRNCIRGPRQTNVDFAITKSFRFGESRSLDFRSEFFNVLNHTNLANPISNLSAATLDASGRIKDPGSFGQIISTSSNPRIVQIALRLTF